MKAEHVMFAGTAILLLGGGYRLAVLERTQGEELRDQAERQHTVTWKIPAQRGDILDCQGRVLAGTRRAPSVFMDPGLIKDPAYEADLIAPTLNLNPYELENLILLHRGEEHAWVKLGVTDEELKAFQRIKIEYRLDAFESVDEPGVGPSICMKPLIVRNPAKAAELLSPILALDREAFELRIRELRGSRFVWVKRDITDLELEDFNRVRREYALQGFGMRREAKRVYTYGRSAAQILGFVGAEQKGLEGIEASCNEQLSGVDGERSAVKDRYGRRVYSEPEAYEPPVDGASVVLTIDAHLQQRVEHHLREAYEKYKPQWCTAVALDPQSGEVLAMAVMPDYDPADPFPEGVDKDAAAELRCNRAIVNAYEPGSIFKPFVAGPALEEGLTNLNETFAVHGPTHKFGSRTIHDVHGYDSLAMYQVISKSSNIGMGMLAERCGNERLYQYVRSFGFGRQTGIDLSGEHEGLLFPLESWTKFSTQSIPIGQEIAVTSLQLVTAFSVFCNDGVLYRPRMIRGIIDSQGRTLEDNSQPIEVRQVLSPDTAKLFRLKALVEVVNDGTGKRAKLDNYQVFGKTGTAQAAYPDRQGYEPGAYIGSFLGGAPADDPRVVVLVSLIRPSTGEYYGGTVAAPTAAAIIADVLEYMQVPTTPPAVGMRCPADAPRGLKHGRMGGRHG